MMILRPYGFGNVVAWGLNLCMPQGSQNCEFAAPGGENYLAANKKSPSMTAGSRRVLTTAMDDWSENLFALAPVRAYAYVR